MGARRSKGSGLSPTLRKRLAQVRACEKSGETLKAFAKRQGFSAHSLYQAKKLARQQGVLPPHRAGVSKPRPKPAVVRKAKPLRFVEAVRPVVQRDAGAAWCLRFSGGEVLEGTAPLETDLMLALVEKLGRRS